MLIFLLIWLGVGIALASVTNRDRSAGLPLAYFVQLSILHLPGALIYLDPQDLSTSALATQIGFEQTVIGLVGFLAGVIVSRCFVGVRKSGREFMIEVAREREIVILADKLAKYYLYVGFAVYFISPLVPAIPSATAILSPLGSLIVVGACLRIWVAGKLRDQFKFWSSMALLPLLPLVTVVHGGFLGFGTMWAVAIASFLYSQSRRKWLYALSAPLALYAGLSLWVNYSPARNEIRELVWYEQAGIKERLDRIGAVFRDFQWFDITNERHREAIDARLNQNFLVGVAVQRLELGEVDYASGATAVGLLVGLIPRAVWPDKPAVGGGGSVVHDFTGIDFAEGTSVGAGQVFEFYINFGVAGVIGGFFLFGFLIGRMDSLVERNLATGNQGGAVTWFLVCLAFLNPGGNLLEVLPTAVASAMVGSGIGVIIRRYMSGDREFASDVIPHHEEPISDVVDLG